MWGQTWKKWALYQGHSGRAAIVQEGPQINALCDRTHTIAIIITI